MSATKDRADFRSFIAELGITRADLKKAAEVTPYVSAPMRSAAVAPSKIHGQGIIARNRIAASSRIGMAMRRGTWTALGRFANHSRRPTAVARKTRAGVQFIALSALTPGAEVTVDYRQVRKLISPKKRKNHV